MRHIIWRNRASAILGIIVMLIPFTGFPEIIRDSLIVLAGFLIALFGFYHGSANYALVEETVSISLDKEPGDVSSGKEELRAEEEHPIEVRAHRRAKKEDQTHDELPSAS